VLERATDEVVATPTLSVDVKPGGPPVHLVQLASAAALFHPAS